MFRLKLFFYLYNVNERNIFVTKKGFEWQTYILDWSKLSLNINTNIQNLLYGSMIPPEGIS